MKLLTTTCFKFALLVALVTLFVTASASAQNARIQITQLDALAAKASETVDVNIDESLMQMTAKFLSSKDPDEAKVKEIVNGLKGIYVKSFEFETEGQYSAADLESIRSQLRNSSWDRIVNVNSKKEGAVEVYLMHSAGVISGLAVLATDPKEITIVNIVGPVDLEKLSALEGNFGVPVLGIEYPKTKRKNDE
jgi:hypothetical protein